MMVSLILGVIIMEGMIIYFRNKKSVTIIAVIFILLTLLQPSFAVFYPIIIYECASITLYSLVPMHMLVAMIAYIGSLGYSPVSKETELLFVFMLVSLAMGMKNYRENQMKDKIHNLQDEQSYLKQKNKQNQDELARKQDYEIHAATLTERNRIAREIHDHVGHMLSRSILQL